LHATRRDTRSNRVVKMLTVTVSHAPLPRMPTKVWVLKAANACAYIARPSTVSASIT